MGFWGKSPILFGISVISLLVLISLVTQVEAGVIIGEQYYDYYCPMCNQVFTLPGGGIAFFDQYGNLDSTAWSSSFPTPSPYIPSNVPNITQPEPEPLPFLICKPSLISVEDLYVPDAATGLSRMGFTAWKQHHTLDSFEKNPSALEECLITMDSGVGQSMQYSEELFQSKRDAENAYNQRIQEYPNEANLRKEVHSDVPTPIGSNSILFLTRSMQTLYGYDNTGRTLIFQSGPYLISLHSSMDYHAIDGTTLGNWGKIYDEKFLRDAADSVKKIIASSDSLVISKAGMTADITIPKCENSLISLDEFRSIAGDDSYIAKSGDYIKFSKDYSMDNLQETLPLLDDFCQLVFEKKPNHNAEPTDQVVIWQLKWKSDVNALKSYDEVLNVAKDDSKLAVAVGHMTANSFESVENDKTSNVFQKGSYTLIAAHTSVPGTIEKLSDSDFKEIVETVYDKIPGSNSSPQPTPQQPTPPQPTPPQPTPSPTPSPLLDSSQGIHHSNLRIVSSGKTISSGLVGGDGFLYVDLENRGAVEKTFTFFISSNDFARTSYATLTLQPGESTSITQGGFPFTKPLKLKFDHYILKQLPELSKEDLIRFVKDSRNQLAPPLSLNFQIMVDSPSVTEESKIKIPKWIKNNADWWVKGSIDDSSFLSGIEYMIKEEIIRVPISASSQETGDDSIPSWIKQNADWWAKDLISDEEFANAIGYLVEKRIIRVG